MKYKTSAQMAEKWGISDRYVRNLCKQERVEGTYQENGVWYIPENLPRPKRGKTGPKPKAPEEINPPKLLKKLIHQRDGRNYSGLYDYSQVNMAYSSCRMASGRLTREQITLIMQKDKILTYNERLKVNDIIEGRNHLRAFDLILDMAAEPLAPELVLSLHRLLLSDSCDHKRREVITGEFRTSVPKDDPKTFSKPAKISADLSVLIRSYESRASFSLEDILDFHVRFERIRPFDEANGRIGRLIMFKECLRHDIVPFIIDDKRRSRYLEGIRKWDKSHAILEEVVLEAQKRYQDQIELQVLIATHHEMHPEFD